MRTFGSSGWSSFSSRLYFNISAGLPPGSFGLSGTAYCNTSFPEAPAVQLTWSSSSSASSYDVYRNGSLYAGGINGTSFDNNANVVGGQSYTYFVRAQNSDGSTESNSITVFVPSDICPQAPGPFTLSGTAYCNTSFPEAPAVDLNWSSSARATSYDVYRNGSLYASGISGTSFDNNANVVGGQSYTYFVRARNSDGSTDSSAIEIAIPINICENLPSLPEPDFAWNPETPSASQQVQFTDLSTGEIFTRTWDFNDDGVTDSTTQNPVWSYAAPGIFHVTLRVENAYGIATETREIQVHGDGTAPVITGVSREWPGFFLEGVSLDNRFDLSVDWGGTPGSLAVSVNGGAPKLEPGTIGGGYSGFGPSRAGLRLESTSPQPMLKA